MAPVTLMAGLLLAAGPAGGFGARPADLVVRHATIHTAAAERPLAHALAVRDGRIVAVGEEREVALLIGPRTRVMDLRGLTVLPGLVDSHGHLLGLGATLEQVHLAGTTS